MFTKKLSIIFMVVAISLCFYLPSSFLDDYHTFISRVCKENTTSYNSKIGKLSEPLRQLLTERNYPLEEYEVTTEDGYQLTVFRMPNNPARKGVVFLQHPATGGCMVFLDKYNKSLGFMLHNAGYDVWIGNMRGSYYGQKHVTLHPESEAFWNFSIHELGVYDLPAMIDLVKEKTGGHKIAYIGHSLSTTSAAIYASAKHEHAKANIQIIVFMATTVYQYPLRSTDSATAPYHRFIYATSNFFNFHSMFPLRGRLNELIKFCTKDLLFRKICSYVLDGLGATASEMEPVFMDLMCMQDPYSISMKGVNHYSQNVMTKGRFRYYDYGRRRNLIAYGSAEPPDYPIKKITVPLYVMSGSIDPTSTPESAERFYKNVSTKPEDLYGHDILEGYGHVAFLYNSTAHIDVNLKIMRVLDKAFRKK